MITFVSKPFICFPGDMILLASGIAFWTEKRLRRALFGISLVCNRERKFCSVGQNISKLRGYFINTLVSRF